MTSDESPRGGLQAPAAMRQPECELDVSAERWAVLAPKLRALMDDFRRLEALDDPALEPVLAACPPDGGDDAG